MGGGGEREERFSLWGRGDSYYAVEGEGMSGKESSFGREKKRISFAGRDRGGKVGKGKKSPFFAYRKGKRQFREKEKANLLAFGTLKGEGNNPKKNGGKKLSH